MPVGTLREGDFTIEQANNGIFVSNVPGSSGPGPISVVVFMSNVDPLPISDPTITIQMFPSGRFTQGTDSNGNISVTTTFSSLDETGKNWGWTGGGSGTFENGFDGQQFRSAVNYLDFGKIKWQMTFLVFDISSVDDWPGPVLIQPPENLDQKDLEWDEEKQEGSVTLTFTYDNTLGENPTGFAAEFSPDGGTTWFPDGNTLFEDGIDEYEIKVYTFENPSTFEERVRAYKLDPDPDNNQRSDPTPPVVLIWDDDVPDITITGSGQIDMGGAATIILQADSSGIYTLVEGKTDDTLYNHSGVPTTLNVKIPDPFIKTGFLE